MNFEADILKWAAFAKSRYSLPCDSNVESNVKAAGYSLCFQNVKGWHMPKILYENLDQGHEISVQLTFSLYRLDSGTFFGSTWMGNSIVLHSGSGKKSSLPDLIDFNYPEPLYVLSKASDPSCVGVVEVVVSTKDVKHNILLSQFGCGWGLIRVFGPTSGDKLMNVPLYHGSPRELVANMDMSTVTPLGGCQLGFKLYPNKSLLKISSLIEENEIIGKFDVIPGLTPQPVMSDLDGEGVVSQAQVCCIGDGEHVDLKTGKIISGGPAANDRYKPQQGLLLRVNDFSFTLPYRTHIESSLRVRIAKIYNVEAASVVIIRKLLRIGLHNGHKMIPTDEYGEECNFQYSLIGIDDDGYDKSQYPSRKADSKDSLAEGSEESGSLQQKSKGEDESKDQLIIQPSKTQQRFIDLYNYIPHECEALTVMLSYVFQIPVGVKDIHDSKNALQMALLDKSVKESEESSAFSAVSICVGMGGFVPSVDGSIRLHTGTGGSSDTPQVQCRLSSDEEQCQLLTSQPVFEDIVDRILKEKGGSEDRDAGRESKGGASKEDEKDSAAVASGPSFTCQFHLQAFDLSKPHVIEYSHGDTVTEAEDDSYSVASDGPRDTENLDNTERQLLELPRFDADRYNLDRHTNTLAHSTEDFEKSIRKHQTKTLKLGNTFTATALSFGETKKGGTFADDLASLPESFIGGTSDSSSIRINPAMYASGRYGGTVEKRGRHSTRVLMDEFVGEGRGREDTAVRHSAQLSLVDRNPYSLLSKSLNMPLSTNGVQNRPISGANKASLFTQNNKPPNLAVPTHAPAASMYGGGNTPLFAREISRAVRTQLVSRGLCKEKAIADRSFGRSRHRQMSSDNLTLHEINIQFGAYRHLTASDVAKPKAVYFTYHFYSCRTTKTEIMRLLQRNNRADDAGEGSSQVHVLAREVAHSYNDENPLTLRYEVDTSTVSPDEPQCFHQYLKQQVLYIDVWDADSGAQLGTCGVPLSRLQRHPSDNFSSWNCESDIIQSNEETGVGSDVVTSVLPHRAPVTGSVVGAVFVVMSNTGHVGAGKINSTHNDHATVPLLTHPTDDDVSLRRSGKLKNRPKHQTRARLISDSSPDLKEVLTSHRKNAETSHSWRSMALNSNRSVESNHTLTYDELDILFRRFAGPKDCIKYTDALLQLLVVTSVTSVMQKLMLVINKCQDNHINMAEVAEKFTSASNILNLENVKEFLHYFFEQGGIEVTRDDITVLSFHIVRAITAQQKDGINSDTTVAQLNEYLLSLYDEQQWKRTAKRLKRAVQEVTIKGCLVEKVLRLLGQKYITKNVAFDGNKKNDITQHPFIAVSDFKVFLQEDVGALTSLLTYRDVESILKEFGKLSTSFTVSTVAVNNASKSDTIGAANSGSGEGDQKKEEGAEPADKAPAATTDLPHDDGSTTQLKGVELKKALAFISPTYTLSGDVGEEGDEAEVTKLTNTFTSIMLNIAEPFGGFVALLSELDSVGDGCIEIDDLVDLVNRKGYLTTPKGSKHDLNISKDDLLTVISVAIGDVTHSSNKGGMGDAKGEDSKEDDDERDSGRGRRRKIIWTSGLLTLLEQGRAAAKRGQFDRKSKKSSSISDDENEADSKDGSSSRYSYSTQHDVLLVEKKLRHLGTSVSKKGSVQIEALFQQMDLRNTGYVNRTQFLEILSSLGMYILEKGKLYDNNHDFGLDDREDEAGPHRNSLAKAQRRQVGESGRSYVDRRSSSKLLQGVSQVSTDFHEHAESMELIKWYRQSQKKQLLQRMMSHHLAVKLRLYPRFGTTLFFEYPITNPFAHEEVFTIDIQDPELRLVTDFSEWCLLRHSCVPCCEGAALGPDPVEAEVFTYNNSTGLIHVALLPHETFYLPFSFLTLLPYAPPSELTMQEIIRKRRAHESKDEEADNEPQTHVECTRTAAVKIISGTHGHVITTIQVDICPRPFVVHRTLRFLACANSIMKRRIQLVAGNRGNTYSDGDDVEGFYEDAGNSEGKFVHCVESGMQSRVVVEWGAPGSNSDAQPTHGNTDILFRYRTAEYPSAGSFFVLLYEDSQQTQLYEIWQVFVQTRQKLDIHGSIGAPSNVDLVVKSDVSSTRRCRAFGNGGLTFSPKGVFQLVPGVYNKVVASIIPKCVGVSHSQVTIMDIDTRECVGAWLVCVSANTPVTMRQYDVSLSPQPKNMKIIIKNPWDVPRKYQLLSSNSSLMKPRVSSVDMQALGNAVIHLWFQGSQPHAATGDSYTNNEEEVYLFLNSENGQNEESFLFRIRH